MPDVHELLLRGLARELRHPPRALVLGVLRVERLAPLDFEAERGWSRRSSCSFATASRCAVACSVSLVAARARISSRSAESASRASRACVASAAARAAL